MASLTSLRISSFLISDSVMIGRTNWTYQRLIPVRNNLESGLIFVLNPLFRVMRNDRH